MIRHIFMGLVMTVVLSGGLLAALPADEARKAFSMAEEESEIARTAIEREREFLELIPENSPFMPDIVRVLQTASENWNITVDSLQGARKCVSMMNSAVGEKVSDYAMLAKVSAHVALSGAKMVQIAFNYINAVVNHKTEALDIIGKALEHAESTYVHLLSGYERVKMLMGEKYSSN